MTDFVHLHNHTDYSLLDGAANITRLVDTAAGQGMKALAITDHGNMFGVLRFYTECRKKRDKTHYRLRILCCTRFNAG